MEQKLQFFFISQSPTHRFIAIYKKFEIPKNMSATLQKLVGDFTANMPSVHPFSSITDRKSKNYRVEAARTILAAIGGSEAEALEICREIAGHTVKEVAIFAGQLMSKNPASGTGPNTIAKATILQLLVPFLNRRQLEECGVPAGQRAYLSAKSRNESAEFLQMDSSTGRSKHIASEEIVTKCLSHIA